MTAEWLYATIISMSKPEWYRVAYGLSMLSKVNCRAFEGALFFRKRGQERFRRRISHSLRQRSASPIRHSYSVIAGKAVAAAFLRFLGSGLLRSTFLWHG
jgi:hypothetical protein